MINILSTKQFNKDDIESILSRASIMEKDLKEGTVKKLLSDKVIACVFFEPSTRTRLSFETAAIRLGANVISVENAEVSSSAFKGESIEDTTRMLSCYADAIVMRHHKALAAEVAASVSTKPILNAGDGANQHPSQALLDVYTIKKEHGRLDNLSIAFVGDLKNSRPLHSLMPIFMFYPNNTFYFISPKELVISEELRGELKDKNIKFVESQNLEETLPKVDVLYMTRVQKERFTNIEDYEKVKDSFLLKKEHLELMKKESIILHPLPRVNEIDKEIDNDHRACYFREAQNGLYVRMALYLYVFGL
ncbi:MAG: aspartate carbamoyltransferase [Candidatus Paceibacterota bacterium]